MTFGATDKPLKAEQLEKDGLAQWPMVMGAIVPVVNLEGVKAGDMVLDGETLAKIYLGKITKWDDPAIKKLNPKLALPSDAITVVHRSDGSGTTFNFTDYLSKVSADWKTKVGSGTAVEWPVGVGAKGNEGVSGNIGQTKNAIGYVEYAYAKQNKLTYTALGQQGRQTVQPTAEAFQAAASNADWAKAPGYYVILTDQPGDKSWPITASTFILMHKDAGRQGGVRRGRQVLQMGLRQRRQDGRRTRLHPDAGLGGQADREDLVGRYQELIDQTGASRHPSALRFARSGQAGPGISTSRINPAIGEIGLNAQPIRIRALSDPDRQIPDRGR